MTINVFIYKDMERNKRETTSPNTSLAISSSSGGRSGLTSSGAGGSGLMTSQTWKEIKERLQAQTPP